MQKSWLKNYHKGVESEIELSKYNSLIELFEQTCRTHNDKPAFDNLGTKLTYAEVHAKSIQFAAYLQHELKMQHGDRIAIMMPNLLQYPIAMFAALRAGLTVVNVNPLYTAPELIHLLNDSGAKTIVIVENFANVLEEALPQTHVENIIVTKIGDMFPQPKAWIVDFVVKHIKKMVPKWQLPNPIRFKQVIAQGKQMPFKKAELNQADIAYLQYTGGTTGVSKGTVLSHGNMIANVLQLGAWVKPRLDPNVPEIVITALPLYHIFSLTVNCLTYTLLGGLNVLITNPRDIPLFVKLLKGIKFTAISGVNTLFNALLHNPNFAKLDFSHLHFSVAGGMAVQQAVAKRWEEVTGKPLIEGYGLTEASPVVTANPLDIKGFTGSIGLPLPATDVTIRDENGESLPVGEVGELCVKGPQVMQGYWQSPEETKKAFTKDGWLRTGDIAKIDENGFVYIVDRKKDMIIVSGFNVFPNEVEDAIAKHPGVLEVAVIGVPDDRSGEIVKAFIVKKDQNLTEDDIIDFCHQTLTRYKVPKAVEFRDELPKTPVGKILRRALRE